MGDVNQDHIKVINIVQVDLLAPFYSLSLRHTRDSIQVDYFVIEYILISMDLTYSQLM